MSTDQLEDFILHHREDFDAEAPTDRVWDRIEAALDEGDDDNDPLEVFVLDNRDAFDDTTPPPRLEGRVFADLAASAPAAAPATRLRVSHRRIGSILGIAATLLLLLAAAFTLGNNRGYRTAEADLVAAEMERIDPDLAAAERYYQREIDAQFTKVDYASDDPQLMQDLSAIDEATAEIRTALLEVPQSQRADLVNKLIETYRIKLDILLKVQQHLPSGATEAPTTQSESNEL